MRYFTLEIIYTRLPDVHFSLHSVLFIIFSSKKRNMKKREKYNANLQINIRIKIKGINIKYLAFQIFQNFLEKLFTVHA